MGKMVKATSKTEFARSELLKTRLAEGMPGVTQDMYDRALASAKSLLEMEMKDSCEKFQSKYGAEDWYKCMRAMYDIVEDNSQWRIISNVRDWKEEREWVMGSKWEAEDKVNKLVYWQHDHIRRGQASADKHIKRGTEILNKKMEAGSV